jgi:DNA gyrase subunit B
MGSPRSSIDQVRKRPGMYAGDTKDGTGLHNLVYEVVGNAINESAAGHAKNISVTLNAGGSCTVNDDGRGIPVDRLPRFDISAPEAILCWLHAGGSYPLGPYQGIGLCPVNALSEWLELRIWRDGFEYRLRCVDGAPETPPRQIGSSSGKRGTEITFKPSSSFFEPIKFDAMKVQGRVSEFSSKYRVAIQFSDGR